MKKKASGSRISKMKRRRANEKFHYDEIFIDNDNDDWRGIVVTPLYSKGGKKLIRLSGTLFPLEQLTAHLLFWEKIAIPKRKKDQTISIEYNLAEYIHNRIISGKMATGFNQIGLNKNNENLNKLALQDQFHIFSNLENKESGKWSTAEPKDFPRIFDQKKSRAILVRLHSAIPVPHNLISLESIANFKANYQDELKHFRNHLDKIFLKIIDSDHNDYSFRTEFDDLAESITSYIDKMENNSRFFNFFDLAVKLEWKIDPKLITLTGVAALLSELENALAIGIAGAAANLIPEVTVEACAAGLSSSKNNPLKYASLIATELTNLKI